LLFGLEVKRRKKENETNHFYTFNKVARKIPIAALDEKDVLHLGTRSHCQVLRAMELTQLTAAEEKLGEPPDVEHDFWALFSLRTVGLMNITVDEETATEYIVDKMLQDTNFVCIDDMRSFFNDGYTLLTRELVKRLVHHYLQKYKYVEGGDNSWIYAIDDDREKSKPLTIYDYAYYEDGWFAT
jgi:hypothetical protein